VSEFADLDPTPEELADLDEVLDEIELEEAAGLLDDDELPGEGPWQDQAAEFEALEATLDASRAASSCATATTAFRCPARPKSGSPRPWAA
jgi:hypothetical protein